jgi:glycosyltransferase involved in cell wall biosynthesis
MRRRRLLTISHSYVVALNRRLAAEIARAGADRWEVTALAPERFRGDLRQIELERSATEPNVLRSVPAYLTRSPHMFLYGPSLAIALREAWDCVHMWEEPYIFAGAQIAATMPRRTPLVFATFQNIRKRYPPPFAQMERFVVRRASAWIAFGQTVASALGDSPGYRSRPFLTIPPGVDMNAFRPDATMRAEAFRRLGWSEEGAPVIGCLGRLVPEKGVPFLMSVLGRVRSGWRALVVGGGPLEGEVRMWGDRHPDRVRLIPAVTHDEVPMYLNAMDVLAAPSETVANWREQFGRMIIEAFACGVPVIGSDSGEVPFTIGDAGVVVRERDERAWVEALSDLLDNSAKRRDLAAAGRARAATHFDWRVVGRKTLDFLAQSAISKDLETVPK